MYSKIVGTGRYLPEKILTNFDLEKMVDTSDEWIRARTGVERRHCVRDDETTSDMCVEAAKVAIADAGVGINEIDLVIDGTTTPDLIFPNCATLVQHRLGIPACPAIGMEAACTSFIYALTTADDAVRVQLVGEGLFEVTPNEARTFTVEANDALVSVLGTRFNVSTWGTQTMVYLEEGRVQFSHPSSAQAVVLTPGQQSVLTEDGVLEAPDADTADRLIADKITSARWKDHLGASDSLFVNAGTWGLMLTGRILSLD